jgi:hypothetical protein
MKCEGSNQAFLRVALGWALSAAFLLLFLNNLISSWLLTAMLVPTLGIYVWGVVGFAKATGCGAARTLFMLCWDYGFLPSRSSCGWTKDSSLS